MISYGVAWIILIIAGCFVDSVSDIPLYAVCGSVLYIAIYTIIHRKELKRHGIM